ncbi:MAG: RAMP superfamily CRISPR-associated protein [Bacteroidota bacterium]|nr:RAMP superfamily CRISPR-associated protein [Bacteroidota bacterium]
MTIKYKIELLSDWHVGSGLDSGADADAVVLKDDKNLPYIPGKTIKGLLKDSLFEICDVNQIEQKLVNELLGYEIKDDNKKIIKTVSGNSFFSNAELKADEQEEISTNKLSSQLYKNIASTKIKKNGVAEKNSLRTMEVCIPLTLTGNIETEIENAEEILNYAFKWTRNLGVNRNRGLGRCKFSNINN